jgi:hypothetical protein
MLQFVKKASILTQLLIQHERVTNNVKQ